MKLRYLFVTIFCLLAMLPMMMFWLWPYSKALDSELNDVRERHLVIAQNLSGAFERYYRDVTSVFNVLGLQQSSQLKSANMKYLLSSYYFDLIVKTDDNGVVVQCLFDGDRGCPARLSASIMAHARVSLQPKTVSVSTVTRDDELNTGPILLVVKPSGSHWLIGYLSTQYIVEMGKKVAFGEKGHAAIVDQAGNVLAHPLDSWVASGKNIAKVSAVQKMLAGQTGVTEFYSPALKDDMVAGFTQVSNAGWGVMVPQPKSELKAKAAAIDKTAGTVMFIGLLLALVIVIPVSVFLIRPLERFLLSIKSIEQGKTKAPVDFATSRWTPTEIKQLKYAFAELMENVQSNQKAIAELAFIDCVSGLPNRAYFETLTMKALADLCPERDIAAMVFIDFDDFKKVNDNYGHRVGDKLLKLFSQELAWQCSHSMNPTLNYYDNLPDIIPTRLGGDEFALFIHRMKSTEQIHQLVEQITQAVFTEYAIDDDLAITLSGSVGLALYPEQGRNFDTLIKLSDLVMYQNKARRKSA
ncbi:MULTISPECIES: diguanylate cyclase domain-containing protein [unclassified Vibrio]|uniref:Diguanylate cyclase n=1 Tax=Vibrio sp. HB236076 TaxID=3232307 RepID=A0AB39H8W2_9VIBR|nr:diguanylate cyclase [Vibrio sp. HB161653]MDP5253857.1 diguanylate cyclase [Vibrio sp. HB161653]